MTKHDEQPAKLSERQLKAIPFLVSAPTVEAGCKAARVSKNALYTWLRNVEFREALRQAREETVADALAILSQNVTRAVEALITLLEKTESETLRRLIANDVIGHALKARELEDLEKRISNLEKIMRQT